LAVSDTGPDNALMGEGLGATVIQQE